MPLAAIAVLVSACGEDPPTPPPLVAQVRQVTVSPNGVTLNPGQTLQMTAAVTADAGCNASFSWSGNDATRATVSGSGLVTALATAASGSVEIRATATCAAGGSSGSGVATVAVVAPPALRPATIEFVEAGARTFADSVFRPAVRVLVKDQNGAPYLTPVRIEVALAAGPAGGQLLGGTGVQTNASGFAVFSDLRIPLVGSGYALRASLPGGSVATVTGPSFEVVAPPIKIDSLALRLTSDSGQRAAGVLQFQISGAAPSLQPGAVLVGAENGGFLRKVRSSSVSGSTLTVLTDPAALTDVIQNGGVRISTPISFAPNALSSGTPSGIRWGPATATAMIPGVTVSNGVIRLADVKLWDGGADKLVIHNGTIAFNPSFGLDIDIADWTITLLEAKIGGSVTFDADIGYVVSGAVTRSLPTMSIASLSRSFLTFVGPVPVAGRVIVSWLLVPEIGASAAASIETGVTATGGLTLGARYANGNWSSLIDPQATFTIKPLTVTAKGGAYARVGGKVEVNVLLYETFAPYMWAGPYLRGDISADLVANQWSSSCTSGIEAGLGFRVQIFSSVLTNFNLSREFLKSSWPVCQRAGPLVAAPTLAIVSGDGQTGTVSTALANPLVVQVTNGSGAPVAGVKVDFAVTSGAGLVTASTLTTDTQGKAQVGWTLGPNAGPQSVTASVLGATGSPVTFGASGFLAAPTLAKVSGDGQFGTGSTALANPLVVSLTNSNGSPAAGVPVAFAVASGGGSVAPTTGQTNAQGRAQTTWTLGAAGGPQTVTATVTGATHSPTTFTAMASGTPSGLVAFYPLDGTGVDGSANQVNGVVTGATAAVGHTGQNSTALLFTSGSVVTIPSSPAVKNLTSAMTLAFWVKRGPAPITSGMLPVARRESGNRIHFLAYSQPGGFAFQCCSSGGSSPGMFYTPSGSGLATINNGAWHQVAFTRMFGVGGFTRIYLDGGLLSGSYSSGAASDFVAAFDAQLLIGRQASGSSGQYLGYLDNVYLFNRVLSASEMQALP